MKMNFLAIGLLGATLATTAVFADDTNTATQGSTPTTNNQQQTTTAPTDMNNATTAPATTQTGNGNGQTSAQ